MRKKNKKIARVKRIFLIHKILKKIKKLIILNFHNKNSLLHFRMTKNYIHNLNFQVKKVK